MKPSLCDSYVYYIPASTWEPPFSKIMIPWPKNGSLRKLRSMFCHEKNYSPPYFLFKESLSPLFVLSKKAFAPFFSPPKRSSSPFFSLKKSQRHRHRYREDVHKLHYECSVTHDSVSSRRWREEKSRTIEFNGLRYVSSKICAYRLKIFQSLDTNIRGQTAWADNQKNGLSNFH